MISTFALVVIIVIDQFRTDELLRHQHLNPAGIGRLVKDGIFYDDAHHLQFFNMTCPGHAAISTGALPGLHGIMFNDLWDPKAQKFVYCVSDYDHHWIDAAADEDPNNGTSAKRILTSTLGDEVKALWPDESKVVSVAVKDRAAIALGGHHIDGAFWYAAKSHKWTSSDYYYPSKKLPSWLTEFNKRGIGQKFATEELYATSTDAISDTTDVAIAAFEGENLGRHKTPDLLWISYSTHDYVGHIFGDDSTELKTALTAEDDGIARLTEDIRKKLGGKKFAVILTADHGAGVDAVQARKWGVPAGKMNGSQNQKKINECLAKDDIANGSHQAAALNETGLFLTSAVSDVPERRAYAREKAKDCILSQEEGAWYAFTRDEILSNRIPQAPWLKNLESSYNPERGPDVVSVLKPYWNSYDNRIVNHETSYDYDSWVPLAIWWNGIHAKKIHRRVSVTSLAPTLARLLETRRPSGASDEYLTEVLDSAP